MKKIKYFPILIILTGVLLLIANLDIINNTFLKLWPLYIITIGIIKILNSIITNSNNNNS